MTTLITGENLVDPDLPTQSAPEEVGFSTKKFVLQALTEKASSVVPSKDVLPVLKNFLVEVSPTRLRVVATDLELSVVTETEMVSVTTPGTFVLPAKRILDIIREGEDGDGVISVSEGVASVTIGHTHWQLRLESGKDYPALPETSEVELHSIDRVKFLGAIQSVRYAACQDVTRPALMLINIENGVMTASDGVRFQQVSLGEFPLAVQIPIGAVDDLVRLLRTTELEFIQIGESDNHIVFKIGADVFIANKVMVTFPDMEAIILRPALENKDTFTVDREALLAAVKRVRITADPNSNAIALNLSMDNVTVMAKDSMNNLSYESISAGWNYPDRRVVVNHKFLTDMLAMYSGMSCTFKLGKDTATKKSMLLLTDDSTGSVGVIGQMHAEWVSA